MKHMVFAFGSNLDLGQILRRCPNVGLKGPVMLHDHKLAFASNSTRWGGGVATVVSAPGLRVPGLLYEMPTLDLERLDRYEGVPTCYERILLPVRQSRPSRSSRAFVYRLRQLSLAPPSGAYVRLIWEAYRSWGFDGGVLADAIAEACEGNAEYQRARELALKIKAATSAA